MQSQIVIDLRLLNANHRARVHAQSASDYVAKLIPAFTPLGVHARSAPSDAASIWEEWLSVPEDRPGRRFGFDA